MVIEATILAVGFCASMVIPDNKLLGPKTLTIVHRVYINDVKMSADEIIKSIHYHNPIRRIMEDGNTRNQRGHHEKI